MKLLWTEQGWDDYEYWQRTDRDMVDKINVILRDLKRSPFRGLGKPEPLRNEMAGWWARRINQEHRLVYRVFGKGIDQAVEIAACRFHYTR
jgi:toxin YoeB